MNNVCVQMEDMPPRLAMLIDRVKQATCYQHVVDALGGALGEVGERAQFYQWRWNKREKDGLMPVGAAAVHAGGAFRSFRPENFPHYDLASYEGAAAGAGFDDIDDDIGDEPEYGQREEEVKYIRFRSDGGHEIGDGEIDDGIDDGIDYAIGDDNDDEVGDH